MRPGLFAVARESMDEDNAFVTVSLHCMNILRLSYSTMASEGSATTLTPVGPSVAYLFCH
jgi:hypothetical protein